MTPLGQELTTLKLNWRQAEPLWQAASEDFARGAIGETHVFQAANGVRLESTWATKEYEILKDDPHVNLIYHTVGPESQLPLVDLVLAPVGS